MIASVRGVVQALDGDGCVIETGGGVGYRLLASARTLARLETGAAGFLLVEMQVREDQITLFGFATPAERLWFAHLTSVQGVGGRVALAILSALSIEDLERAIAGDDKAMIARANGVGPRLATRIISELKTRAPALAAIGGARPALAGSHGRDAVSALENLGFRTIDATRAVDAAAGELGPDGELVALVRLALRKANEGRPA